MSSEHTTWRYNAAMNSSARILFLLYDKVPTFLHNFQGSNSQKSLLVILFFTASLCIFDTKSSQKHTLNWIPCNFSCSNQIFPTKLNELNLFAHQIRCKYHTILQHKVEWMFNIFENYVWFINFFFINKDFNFLIIK